MTKDGDERTGVREELCQDVLCGVQQLAFPSVGLWLLSSCEPQFPHLQSGENVATPFTAEANARTGLMLADVFSRCPLLPLRAAEHPALPQEPRLPITPVFAAGEEP